MNEVFKKDMTGILKVLREYYLDGGEPEVVLDDIEFLLSVVYDDEGLPSALAFIEFLSRTRRTVMDTTMQSDRTCAECSEPVEATVVYDDRGEVFCDASCANEFERRNGGEGGW